MQCICVCLLIGVVKLHLVPLANGGGSEKRHGYQNQKSCILLQENQPKRCFTVKLIFVLSIFIDFVSGNCYVVFFLFFEVRYLMMNTLMKEKKISYSESRSVLKVQKTLYYAHNG